MSLPSRLAGAWLRQRSPTRRVAAWALAVAGPLVLTLAALPLRSSLVLGGFFFRMMLVVIAAAALGGARPALATVVLGVLARELFFAPPFESPRADLRPNVISLIGFAVAGAVVAILIGELAQLAEEQASSRRVEAPLWRVATLVTDGAPADELFAAVAQEAGELLQADQALMNRYESDGTGDLRRWLEQDRRRHPLGHAAAPRGEEPHHDGRRDRSSGSDGQLRRRHRRGRRGRQRIPFPLSGRGTDHGTGPPVGRLARRLGQRAATGHRYRGAPRLHHGAGRDRDLQRSQRHGTQGLPSTDRRHG